MSGFSSERRSLFINTKTSSEEEAINSGFRWLLLQNTEENRKSLFLAVNSVDSLRGAILSTLGESAVRALVSKGRMNFSRALLRLITVSNAAPLWEAKSSVVLALYPDRVLLGVLDSCPTISQILLVPRRLSDIEEWIPKWNAMDLKSQ